MCVYVLKGGVSCYSTYKTIVLRSVTYVAILVQIFCSFLVINTKIIDLKFPVSNIMYVKSHHS